MHAFNTTSAHADQPSTMRNYITWAGGNRWYTGTGDNGPRWVAQWGETDINTKYETPLCPNITTTVPRIRTGTGAWARSAEKSDGRNTRDMLTWTEVEKNQDLTMSALFNIPKSYFPEGNSNNKKALNEFAVANLVDTSSLNGAMKYGVYVATTTVHSNLKITINGTKAGNVTFKSGTGNSSSAVVKATKSISANTDTEITIDHLDADTNIYLIYAPTGDDYGKISKLQILQEQTWEYD